MSTAFINRKKSFIKANGGHLTREGSSAHVLTPYAKILDASVSGDAQTTEHVPNVKERESSTERLHEEAIVAMKEVKYKPLLSRKKSPETILREKTLADAAIFMASTPILDRKKSQERILEERALAAAAAALAAAAAEAERTKVHIPFSNRRRPRLPKNSNEYPATVFEFLLISNKSTLLEYCSFIERKSIHQINKRSGKIMMPLLVSTYILNIDGMSHDRLLELAASVRTVVVQKSYAVAALHACADLQHITFRNGFEGSVTGLLSDYTTDIVFQNACGCTSVNNLPIFLRNLSLGYSFNAKVNNLPNGLISLYTNDMFNRPVNNLPHTLQYLTFGEFFNGNVNHLPPGLLGLKFGTGFNKPVDNLPTTLTFLQLGNMFNRPVDHLPVSLWKLTLGYSFDQPLDNLPGSLYYLRVNKHYERPVNNLPASLREFHAGVINAGGFAQLPDGLERLSLEESLDASISNLPTALVQVVFGEDFYHSLIALPRNVESVCVLCDEPGYVLATLNHNVYVVEGSDPEYYCVTNGDHRTISLKDFFTTWVTDTCGNTRYSHFRIQG